MLFNSYEFAALLSIVFPVYLLLRRYSRQNLLLLAASYIFYGWWDYRFLALLWLSTLVDFVIGLRLERTAEKNRRLLVIASCMVNLGMLGFFKYWDLFALTGNGIGS
jgi:D-alanyl-lipoteichoic acid acyltransferase DltB (MBOAT superfamily)